LIVCFQSRVQSADRFDFFLSFFYKIHTEKYHSIAKKVITQFTFFLFFFDDIFNKKYFLENKIYLLILEKFIIIYVLK